MIFAVHHPVVTGLPRTLIRVQESAQNIRVRSLSKSWMQDYVFLRYVDLVWLLFLIVHLSFELFIACFLVKNGHQETWWSILSWQSGAICNCRLDKTLPQANPMVIIVCGDGSAHNRVMYHLTCLFTFKTLRGFNLCHSIEKPETRIHRSLQTKTQMS